MTTPGEKLKGLVAKVLLLEDGLVRDNSNFFSIGGDSISALELTRLSKAEGLFLTVDDIFDNPILSDLVQVSTAKSSSNDSRKKLQEKASLKPKANGGILCREAGENNCVPLPTTSFQRWSLSAMHYRYFRIALPGNVDKNRLSKACEMLAHRHESLRTVFVEQDGDTGKNVLQTVHPPTPIRIKEIHGVASLDKHCDNDTWNSVEPPTDGNPPFQVQIVKLQDARLYLVLRFAHAQWDGSSLASITSDLSAAYNGLELPPTTPYYQHACAAWATHNDDAYDFWRRTLKGSEMTKVDAKLLPLCVKESIGAGTGVKNEKPYTVKITKSIPKIPSSALPANFSRGTVIKAAWAVTLMHCFPGENQLQDVVFGQVTNGRALGVPNESGIIGPCTNIIPARVRLTGPSVTKRELFRQVQQLYLDTRRFENLETEAIVKNCTSWPSDTKYGSIVRFQNYDFSPSTLLDGVACEGSLYYLPNLPSPIANLAVFPLETELSMVMTVSSSTLNEQEAQYVMDEFCKLVQDFSCDQSLDDPVKLLVR